MANFGFRQLVVVDPYAAAWRETRSAVHASAVVQNAKKFKTLKEAISSAHVVVGTSAGSRRNQAGRWIGLEDLRAIVNENAQARRRMALVFGSEKSGLSNDELGFCHFIVKIPTVPQCPSMNLAQAVAIVAYAVRRDGPASGALIEKSSVIQVDQIERLIAQGLNAFTAAGLLKGWDLIRSERRLRKAFLRWNLSPVDVAMLHGIFRWVIKKAP